MRKFLIVFSRRLLPKLRHAFIGKWKCKQRYSELCYDQLLCSLKKFNEKILEIYDAIYKRMNMINEGDVQFSSGNHMHSRLRRYQQRIRSYNQQRIEDKLNRATQASCTITSLIHSTLFELLTFPYLLHEQSTLSSFSKAWLNSYKFETRNDSIFISVNT